MQSSFFMDYWMVLYLGTVESPETCRSGLWLGVGRGRRFSFRLLRRFLFDDGSLFLFRGRIHDRGVVLSLLLSRRGRSHSFGFLFARSEKRSTSQDAD